MMRAMLVALTTLAIVGTHCALAEAGTPAARFAVQLFSVKGALRSDFDGTLAALASQGFQGVEFAGQYGAFRNDPAGLRAAIDRHGLQCAGAHTPLLLLNASHFSATTAFYDVLGCKSLIVPMDPRAATREGAAQLARDLTALSARLAPLGMKIGYHNHAEEMAGADGQEPWTVIGNGTPAAVILQQDTGWTTFAGKDPVAMVKRFPGRTVTIHYKAKLPQGTAGIPIIGQDRTDWAALTEAGRSVGGAEWIIVEQEDYPNGMGELEAVGASLRGLQAILAR